MYKYLRYLGILSFALFRKVVGLIWFFPVVPFRKWARNIVQNYVLDNDIYLARLLERDIRKGKVYYYIAPGHGTTGGKIKRRKVSWLLYQFTYWFVWAWVDDDSFCDTTSESFIREHIKDTRNPQGISDKRAGECLGKCNGSAFDKGDDVTENWCGWLSVKWMIRNTSFNFRYMQWETNNLDHVFLIEFKSIGWKFGWIRSERQLIAGSINYHMVAFDWE